MDDSRFRDRLVHFFPLFLSVNPILYQLSGFFSWQNCLQWLVRMAASCQSFCQRSLLPSLLFCSLLSHYFDYPISYCVIFWPFRFLCNCWSWLFILILSKQIRNAIISSLKKCEIQIYLQSSTTNILLVPHYLRISCVWNRAFWTFLMKILCE